jgi:cysteine desulfurase
VSIYLDHNATTPIDPEVVEEMLPYLGEAFGNPSSIHAFGQRARRALDLARERVARLIGAAPDEIVFTSGGTEADNLAIRGAHDAATRGARHVVTSAIEHQAVLEPCRGLEALGTRVTFVGVSGEGIVDVDELVGAFGADTVLVSLMAANNDVGVIQPVKEVANAARELGITVHSDAVQAVGKLPIDVAELGVDLLSLSAHKIYGPKGAGALYVKQGTDLRALLRGGHHEARRRAGTENVPAIVGFGKACELAADRLAVDAERVAGLRDRLEVGLLDRVPRTRVNGDRALRLPGTTNVGFAGIDGDELVMAIDLSGVAVSRGSACTENSREPSHVLAAMGCPPDIARGSIRFSLGRGNTEQEVVQALEVVCDVVGRLRAGDARSAGSSAGGP